MKKITIKNKKYTYSVYHKKSIKENYTKLFKVINEITIKTWGNPGNLVKTWFDLADIIIILTKDNKYQGFAIGNYSINNTAVLVSTMVIPEAQNHGLALYMNKKIILKGFLKHLFSKNIFKHYYFAFRTPNPKLYAITINKKNIFPSYLGKKPSKEIINICYKIKENFSPNLELDINNFIIKGAYTNFQNLIYKKDNIPWSNNSKINNFFEKKLKLSKMEGNTMVIIGKIY